LRTPVTFFHSIRAPWCCCCCKAHEFSTSAISLSVQIVVFRSVTIIPFRPPHPPIFQNFPWPPVLPNKTIIIFTTFVSFNRIVMILQNECVGDNFIDLIMGIHSALRNFCWATKFEDSFMSQEHEFEHSWIEWLKNNNFVSFIVLNWFRRTQVWIVSDFSIIERVHFPLKILIFRMKFWTKSCLVMFACRGFALFIDVCNIEGLSLSLSLSLSLCLSVQFFLDCRSCSKVADWKDEEESVLATTTI
jgi:hypothetical protein